MIDQDTAHEVCRASKEMNPILPMGIPLVKQLKNHFVRQISRLKVVVVPLAAEALAGDFPQFGIHQRYQPVDCIAPATLQRRQ
jgi:hypothetical protein